MDDSGHITLLDNSIVNPIVRFYEQRVPHPLLKRDTKAVFPYSGAGTLENRFGSFLSSQLVGSRFLGEIFKAFENLSANRSSLKVDEKNKGVKLWQEPKWLSRFPFNKFSDPINRSKEMVSLTKEQKEQNTKIADKPTTKSEEKKLSSNSPQVSNSIKHVPRIRQKGQPLYTADQSSSNPSEMDWHEQQPMGYHESPVQYYSTPRLPRISGYPGNINSGAEDINLTNYQIPNAPAPRPIQYPQTMQLDKMFYHPSAMFGMPMSPNKYFFGHYQRGIPRQPAAPGYINSEMDHNNFYDTQMGSMQQQIQLRGFPDLQSSGSFQLPGGYEHQATYNVPNYIVTNNGNLLPEMLDPSQVGNVFPRYQNYGIHDQTLHDREYSSAMTEDNYPLHVNAQVNKLNCQNQVQQGYRCEDVPGQDINTANFVPTNDQIFKYGSPTHSASSTNIPSSLLPRKFRPVKIVNPKDVVNKQQSKIPNQTILPNKRPNQVGKHRELRFTDSNGNERPFGNSKPENARLPHLQQSRPQEPSSLPNDVSYGQVFNDVTYYPNIYMSGYPEESPEFPSQIEANNLQTFPPQNPSISGHPYTSTRGSVKGYMPQQNGIASYVGDQQPVIQVMMPPGSTYSSSVPTFSDAKFPNKVAGRFAHQLKQKAFPLSSIPVKQFPLQMNGNIHPNMPSNSFHDPVNGFLPSSMNDDFIPQSNFPNNVLHEADGKYGHLYQQILPNGYPSYTLEDVYSQNQFPSHSDYIIPENSGQQQMPINMPIIYDRGVPNEDMYSKPPGPTFANQPMETRPFQGYYPSKLTGQPSSLSSMNHSFPIFSPFPLPKQTFATVNVPNNLAPSSHSYYSGSDFSHPSNKFTNTPYQWIPYSSIPELTINNHLDNPTLGFPQFTDPASQSFSGEEFNNNQMDMINSDHAHDSNVPNSLPGLFPGEPNVQNTMNSFNPLNYGRSKQKIYSSYKSPYTYVSPYNSPGSANIADYLAPQTNIPPFMQHGNFPNGIIRQPPQSADNSNIPSLSPNEHPEFISSGNMQYISDQRHDLNFPENGAYNWPSQFIDSTYYPNTVESNFYPNFPTDARYGGSLYTPMENIPENTCTLCHNPPVFT